jgi:hypothetical protein
MFFLLLCNLDIYPLRRHFYYRLSAIYLVDICFLAFIEHSLHVKLVYIFASVAADTSTWSSVCLSTFGRLRYTFELLKRISFSLSGGNLT